MVTERGGRISDWVFLLLLVPSMVGFLLAGEWMLAIVLLVGMSGGIRLERLAAVARKRLSVEAAIRNEERQ